MTKRPETTDSGRNPTSGESLSCAQVRELLPGFGATTARRGEREAVNRHLSACRACAEEARFVARIRSVKPDPPPGMVEQVMRRLRESRPAMAGASGGTPTWRPHGTSASEVAGPGQGWTATSWSLAAAAVLVLALGVGVVWSEDQSPVGEGLIASLVTEDDPGPGEEWLVAGAPVWDALPDEVLQTLLEDDEL